MNQIDVDNAWDDGYDAALRSVLTVLKTMIDELKPYKHCDSAEGKAIFHALDKAQAWLWETNND